MITDEQYEAASKQKDAAQAIINRYHAEKAATFRRRLESDKPFSEEELRYSAYARCPCGHGLAYPIGAGAYHYWDCSAILKGIADTNIRHTGKLHFQFYGVKSESEYRGTTRGTVGPGNT